MDKQNQKTSLYMTGAVIGLLLGVISVYFYDRAVSENASDPEKSNASLDVGSMIKLGLLLLGVVRQIAELGAETGKGSKKSA